MALADDDDGYPSRFDSSDDLLHVVVPDDLRELDAEVAAYRRELELARRQRRRQQLLRRLTPGWARGGLPSPLFTTVLLLVATTALLLSVFAPVTQQSQHQLQVSSLAHPRQAPGTVGGLMPDVQLVSGGREIGTRVIRPAIFVLLPAGCKCNSLISQVVSQANEIQPAPFTILVSTGSDMTAAKLAVASDAGHGDANGVRDVDGVLARTYHASATAPTLVLVAANGVVISSPLAFHDGDRLETALAKLRP